MAKFKFWDKLPGFHKKDERDVAKKAKLRSYEKEINALQKTIDNSIKLMGVPKITVSSDFKYEINGDWAFPGQVIYYSGSIVPLLTPVPEPVEVFATKEEEWGF